MINEKDDKIEELEEMITSLTQTNSNHRTKIDGMKEELEEFERRIRIEKFNAIGTINNKPDKKEKSNAALSKSILDHSQGQNAGNTSIMDLMGGFRGGRSAWSQNKSVLGQSTLSKRSLGGDRMSKAVNFATDPEDDKEEMADAGDFDQ